MFKKIAQKLAGKAKVVSQANAAGHFGVRLALIQLTHLLPAFERLFPNAFRRAKHKAILDYLRKHYSHVIEKHRNTMGENPLLTPDCPIFVCWFQGEEAMPPVVKACYASIKQFAQSHPVVLITSENLAEYVQIPEHIIRKLAGGKITLTHFSDIIRAALLSKYNAIWLDATIYLTAPLDWPLTPIHSIKGHAAASSSIAVTRWSPLCRTLPVYARWAGYCFGGGQKLFSFMLDAFCEYWQQEDTLIDYFLIDYFIELAYEKFPETKRLLDEIPINNADAEYFYNRFTDPFDKSALAKILAHCSIFKLNWKFKQRGINTDDLGENTIYRKIIDGTFLS